MIDISNFPAVAKDKKLVERITNKGPWFFYYEKKGREDIDCFRPRNQLHHVVYGFHSAFRKDLLARTSWGRGKRVEHFSPRVEITHVVLHEDESKVLYTEKSSFVFPYVNSYDCFTCWDNPGEYVLFPITRPGVFRQKMLERLEEKDLLQTLVYHPALDTSDSSSPQISMEVALDTIIGLSRDYRRDGCFRV